MGISLIKSPLFRGVPLQTIEVINRDNDVLPSTPPSTADGLVIVASPGLVTTESGGKASFSIKLARQPTDLVSIKLLSSNTNEGAISPANLTFDATNWNNLQTAVITGVDDTNQDGDIAYKILISAPITTDPSFATTPPHEVSVINRDNEEKVVTGAFSPLFLFFMYGVALVLRRQRR